MHRYPIAALLVLLLALPMTTVPNAPAEAQGGCAIPNDASALATRVLALTNQARGGAGRGSLGHDRRLSQAAQALACDIGGSGHMSHRASDGTNSQARVRRAGYRDCIVAENLAWGYPQPTQIVRGWLGSAGHNRNMLHPRVSDAGIGIAQGRSGPIWVMVYASEC